MAQDPRIALTNRATRERSEQQRIADLERRVSILERQAARVQVINSPTRAVRDGTLAADTSLKLWVRIAGAWHFVGLT